MICAFLRKEDPSNPASYLILRGAQWGELRRAGVSLELTSAEAPPTEVRQKIKKLSLESQWAELAEAVESAMALPWSRGWLDLQRHAFRASESLGYATVAGAIKSELAALLGDLPGLIETTLADDTPAANQETQAWIRESVLPANPESKEIPVADLANSSNGHEAGPPNTFDLARQAASQGRVQEALSMLSHGILQEKSGRGRFQRKIELAGICMSTKNEALAFPILNEIAEEIEHRKLEEWEEPATLAKALGLLLRCLEKMGADEATRQKVFQKMCRLDPMQAFTSMRS